MGESDPGVWPCPFFVRWRECPACGQMQYSYGRGWWHSTVIGRADFGLNECERVPCPKTEAAQVQAAP